MSYEDEDDDEETYCSKCERSFGSNRELSLHMRKSSRHNWCRKCSRDFANAAELRSHELRHIPKHMPKVYPCHVCGTKFAWMSSAAKHMEHSKCFGRPSPAVQARMVCEWETDSGNPNLFTTPRVSWHDSDGTTDTSSTYQASEGAWNGQAFECYFCDKEYDTLAILNQHLNSGVHEGKAFHCKHCGFTATRLSGLVEHYEARIGKCGYTSRGLPSA